MNAINPYRYSARRIDTGSNTIDMGVRRFGPDVQSYLERDLYQGAMDDLSLTLDPLTNSRYGFAGGNPISFIEWHGHYFVREGDGGRTRQGGGGGGCDVPQHTTAPDGNHGPTSTQNVTRFRRLSDRHRSGGSRALIAWARTRRERAQEEGISRKECK